MKVNKVIEEGIEILKDTLKTIKESYKVKSEYNTSTTQAQSMYFTGVADMLYKLSNIEYHWSTNDCITFSIVTIDFKGTEKTIYTI
jgi:hypothetical protein